MTAASVPGSVAGTRGARPPWGYDRRGATTRGGYDSRPPYDDGGRGDGRGGYDDRYGGRRDYDSRDRYGGRRDPYDDRDRGYSRFDRDDRGGYGGDRFGPPRGRYEDRGRFGGDRYGDRRRDPRDDPRVIRGTTIRGTRDRPTCAASVTVGGDQGNPVVVIIVLVTRRVGSHKRQVETCRPPASKEETSRPRQGVLEQLFARNEDGEGRRDSAREHPRAAKAGHCRLGHLLVLRL